MKNLRILILEDDIKTLSFFFTALTNLENELLEQGKDLAVTALSEYTQVEEYINKLDSEYFDIILLDRDCKAAGSFHVLDFKKFDSSKIIAISSVPEYNEQAREKGVTRIVHKDYQQLKEFSEKVVNEIKAFYS